ncbi:DUF2155 domain-containing protein [Acidimangrovimonas sediminis]|uniref:DUF2155 domain-containing protein n=1 Tax=Acidimangrovimonas sediminis TaxID=2056283 RepID=UPI001E549F18|nr:DUF2155 domain-containing protein [Acidimangrovimonas sediminis]
MSLGGGTAARWGLLGGLMVALILGAAGQAVSQTYSNGGPQPGDQGIGAPLPFPGRGPSTDGMTIGQQSGQQSGQQTGDQGSGQLDGQAPGQSAGPSGSQAVSPETGSAINQAVGSALDQAIDGQGAQGSQGSQGDQGTQAQAVPGVGQGLGNGAGTATGGTGQNGTGQGAVGQSSAGQNGTGQDYSGQGGFVSDGSGLGHVTNNSGPAQQGPRDETVKVAQAKGGVVRWLDKVSGQTIDIPLQDGQSKQAGRLTIKMTQCRYPVDDPASNAYAYLIIRDSQVDKPIFQGWMIASSPALDPLDSPRYDVWLLHCTTS